MKIDANGSNPDHPVNLMRMVETMTPTLPRVSYQFSMSTHGRREKNTDSQDM